MDSVDPTAPPAGASITLQPITDENRARIEALQVAPDQQRFVDGVTDSLAEAATHPELNPWMRAIYADGTPVGFLMLADGVPDGNELLPWPYYLWRFLVDARHQRHGHGRAALDQLLAYLSTRPGADTLWTSVGLGEGSPLDFYLGYGFERTGEMLDHEHILRLPLVPGAGPAAGAGTGGQVPV